MNIKVNLKLMLTHDPCMTSLVGRNPKTLFLVAIIFFKGFLPIRLVITKPASLHIYHPPHRVGYYPSGSGHTEWKGLSEINMNFKVNLK